jgi:hypothetical protein
LGEPLFVITIENTNKDTNMKKKLAKLKNLEIKNFKIFEIYLIAEIVTVHVKFK